MYEAAICMNFIGDDLAVHSVCLESAMFNKFTVLFQQFLFALLDLNLAALIEKPKLYDCVLGCQQTCNSANVLKCKLL